jgi:lambda family phage tail tape measure protein
MLTIDPVEVKFLADMSQLRRDMEEMKRVVGEGAKQSATGMESMLSGLTSRLTGLLSLAGLQQAFSAVHTATMEAEKSQLLLNGALKSTGYAAGLTKKEIEGLVDELTNSTQFDDEKLREAAAGMLRFRNVQGETFREGLKLAPDLAAALGIDVVDAARAIGRAMEDSVGGMRGLKTAGVRLREEQIDLAEKLAKSGDKAGSAKIAIDALNAAVGGQAGEANQGLSGRTAAAKKAWNELLETIGGGGEHKNSGAAFIEKLTKALAGLKTQMEGGEGSLANDFSNLFRNANPTLVGGNIKAGWDLIDPKFGVGTAAEAEAEKQRAAAGAEAQRVLQEQEAKYLRGKELAKLAADATKKQTEEYQSLIKSIREKIAVGAAELEQDERATEGQKLKAKIMGELRDGTRKLTEAESIVATQELEKLIASDKARDARKVFLKGLEEERKAENEGLQAQFKAIDGLDEEIKKQQEHNEEIGLSAEKLNVLKLARMDDAIAIRERQLAQELATQGDNAHSEALRIQIEQLTKLRNINASSQGKQIGVDAATKAGEAWKRTTENIERSLTDALMRGFEGGADAGKNFRDVLKNMFKTLVLQPLLKPLVEPLARDMSGIGQMLQRAIQGLGSNTSGIDAASATYSQFLTSAKGNVFDSPGLHAHANTVVSQPTMFSFARGAGLMGEAGPEAIMPLRRGRDGRLGVEAAAGGGTTINTSIVVNAEGNSRIQSDAGQGAEIGRRIDAAVRGVLLAERRPGGLLAD